MSSPMIAVASFLLSRARKRTCPACGRVQTVEAKDILKSLPCPTCGRMVPPKQRFAPGR